jgi:hypothetical protein
MKNNKKFSENKGIQRTTGSSKLPAAADALKPGTKMKNSWKAIQFDTIL